MRCALNERHCRHADDLVLSYVSLVDSQMNRQTQVAQVFDKDELNTFVPSAGYLRDVYIEHLLLNREQMLLEMMKRDALYLSVDHSFKIVKLLARIGGSKLLDSALQVRLFLSILEAFSIFLLYSEPTFPFTRVQMSTTK